MNQFPFSWQHCRHGKYLYAVSTAGQPHCQVRQEKILCRRPKIFPIELAPLDSAASQGSNLADKYEHRRHSSIKALQPPATYCHEGLQGNSGKMSDRQIFPHRIQVCSRFIPMAQPEGTGYSLEDADIKNQEIQSLSSLPCHPCLRHEW